MSLKKYSIEELKKEIKLREDEIYFNKWNKIPVNVLQTSLVKREFDNKTLFYCYVDDGMEPFAYLIETKNGLYEKQDIINIVQRDYIINIGGEETMVMGGFSIHNIIVQEIGRYGYKFLKVEDEEE